VNVSIDNEPFKNEVFFIDSCHYYRIKKYLLELQDIDEHVYNQKKKYSRKTKLDNK